MKKIALLLFACFFTLTTVSAQKAKQMEAEIEGKYSLDDNGNVTYVRIIEAPEMSKDEIFSRAQNFFTYNYGSGKSVIQTDDKEKGLLVGKGLYPKIHSGIALHAIKVDTWHILRIDAKEGRARAILSLTTYDKTISSGADLSSLISTNVSDEYPINPKGSQKTVMMKAFYKSHKAAETTLDQVEKAILEGTTSSSIENEDW